MRLPALRWVSEICLLLFTAQGVVACGGPSGVKTVTAASTSAVEPIPDYPGLLIGDASSGLRVEEADGITFGPAHFSLSTHKWLTEEIKCSNWLNSAHYRQDIWEQTSSWAHFDNCDFAEGLSKLQESVAAAKSSASKGKVEDAFGYLGRALHGLQDFYAHTNYVELMEKEHPDDRKAVQPLELWTESGRKKVEELMKGRRNDTPLVSGERLVSGFVWWGAPKLCAGGAKTHGEMAKDSLDTDNGKVKSPSKWGGTRFHAARALAQAETIAFLNATAATWPELKGACGDSITFAVFLDARQAKPNKAP